MSIVSELVADLGEEHESLHTIVASLSDTEWRKPTPADDWSTREQVAHLTYFHDRAAMAIVDPDAFNVELDKMMADPDAFEASTADSAQRLSSTELLSAWELSHDGFATAANGAPDDLRVPWYGVEMSVASKVSARLMETWAHGQDIVDTFAIEREPTARLRHVAMIGVRARPFTYFNNGMEMPDADVHVALQMPGAALWEMGDPTATNRVRGKALDFCLVATQRRHLDDVNLAVTGEAASEWMSMIQAFAGPPGRGRSPLA